MKAYTRLFGLFVLFPEDMELVEMILPQAEGARLVDFLAGWGKFHFSDGDVQASDAVVELAEELRSAAAPLASSAQRVELTVTSWEALLQDQLVRVKGYDRKLKELQQKISQLESQKKSLLQDLAQLERFPDFYDNSVFAKVEGARPFYFRNAPPPDTLAVFRLGDEDWFGVCLTEGKKPPSDAQELAFPVGLGRTAGEARVEVQRRLHELEGQLAQASTEMQALVLEAGPFAARAVELSSMVLASARARKGQPFTRTTLLIRGFVPRSYFNEFLSAVSSFSWLVLVHRLAGPSDMPPTKQSLPKVISSFSIIVSSMGFPSYGEVDPTLITAFTFPALFAVMFPDAGQALLLVIGGILAAKYLKGAMSDLGVVMALSGAAAFFSGLLFGEFFGLEIPPLAFHVLGWKGMMRISGTPFSVWRPSASVSASTRESVIFFMEAAMAIGVAQMTMGFALSFVNLCKKGLLYDAVSSPLLKALILPSGYALVISGTPFFGIGILGWTGLVLIPLAMLFLLPALKRPQATGEAALQLFESLISFLSNTVSYLRLVAMSVAHLALMLVVFVVAWLGLQALGGGEAGWAIFWIVVVLGNVVVMAFEALLVFVQSMRLHFYEWMMKFFSGEGRPYAPLSYDGKNLKLKVVGLSEDKRLPNSRRSVYRKA